MKAKTPKWLSHIQGFFLYCISFLIILLLVAAMTLKDVFDFLVKLFTFYKKNKEEKDEHENVD